MGYSTNIKTLEAQLDNLAMLRQGKACAWTVAPNESHRFAYKIREALWIARNVPEARNKYPELARAAEHFRIEVTSSREVQARAARSTVDAEVRPLGGGVTTGLEAAGPPKALMGPQTAASIIQTWMDTQPSNERYHFPQANLTRDELLKLHGWAVQQGWIFFESDGAITLQRKTLDVAEFAWSPEDLNEGMEED